MSYDTDITIICDDLNRLGEIAEAFGHHELVQACSCNGRGGATSRSFRDAVVRSAIAMKHAVAVGMVPPFLVHGRGEGYSDGRDDFWSIAMRGGDPHFARGEITYTRPYFTLEALDLP